YNQVTDLYLFESAIDAMSFYELQGFSKQTTSAFISVGGHVTQGQIEKLIKVFSPTPNGTATLTKT
ncbi:toprim domain-containing protein, partial [Bacteroides fragilis]